MENENREQPLEELANVSIETGEKGAVSDNGSQAEGEQAVVSQQEADNSQEPDNLGKFKSTQALLDAYNNLQSEFTKKCQRLSELEKDKTQLDLQIKQQNEQETEKKQENNENFAENLAAFLEKDTKTQQIVDKYVLSNENVRNSIIEYYINSLNKQNVPPVITQSKGQRVAEDTPATPSSLADAKSFMEKMFN